MHNLWCYWLVCMNLVSALLFVYDKQAARHNRRRIPERTLHLLELFGGAFANIVLMYCLRHKNRKFSYWGWTWLIGALWIVIFVYLFKHINILDIFS